MLLQGSKFTKIAIALVTWIVTASTEENSTVVNEYDAVQLIRGAGYPAEEHRVQTADGYILTLHRIPLRERRPWRRSRLPLLLQHGLWSSSYHWLNQGPKHCLPFLLSDAGYDVWLGNARGNFISRDHSFLSAEKDQSFWNFSFHEMGLYDLPAVIDYITNTTGKSNIEYIGHSMGTTMFFVMASLRPDVARKVHFMFALAPIATVGPIRRSWRYLVFVEEFILRNFKYSDVLLDNGISWKTVMHYTQIYLSGNFTMYSYGQKQNMQLYNASVPTQYVMSNISVPILLCYGTKDYFVHMEDVRHLAASLGNPVGTLEVPLSHMQFSGGEEARRVLYDAIVSQMH